LICNFIGFLFDKNLSATTIASHISAISYIHKISALPDPTNTFIVKKILKGTQNLKTNLDARMPITKPILVKILNAVDHTVPDLYNRTLLKAVFLLAFHAFLRLGELAIRNRAQFGNVLQKNDVVFDDQGVQIVLRHFKNIKNNQPVTIFLSPSISETICPVRALQQYVELATHTTGPLFTFRSGSPVSHSYVVQQLKSALKFSSLDCNQYKGHSFRIGAATEAANLGFSENYIQQLGRWHSNAIKRYIRINSFHL
jgi:integrase